MSKKCLFGPMLQTKLKGVVFLCDFCNSRLKRFSHFPIKAYYLTVSPEKNNQLITERKASLFL